MDNSKDAYSREVTTEHITRIDFSIQSNADIMKSSAISDPAGITVADTATNDEATNGGVIDPRLGVTEDRSFCATCNESAYTCPGHFGHIKLTEPVFHPGYLTYIKNILSCVCIKCHKLLVYKNEKEISKMLLNKPGKQRFLEIRNACKGVTHCQKEHYGCGSPAHKISSDKNNATLLLLAEPKKSTSGDSNQQKKITPKILTPQFCYYILKNISDEDCLIMGIDPAKSRPEDMICINFPVPPIQVRPSIKMEISGQSSIYDDLTHKIVDIVKNNENLKNTKAAGSVSRTSNGKEDFILLQFHVATYLDNTTVGLPRSQQKNKKVTKSLSERLKGKEGRVRGNLMGKRVNFSARTVITSDPNIALNEVGVPMVIAKNLTYPEYVTTKNIDYLTELVRNGRTKYPGANFIRKTIVNEDGRDEMRVISLKHIQNMPTLNIGDIVDRHLVNGDVVIFNRQPSLHKMSMMGHKIHVLADPKILTFRVNVSVTDPYNADWYRC